MSLPNVETDEQTKLAIIKENHEQSAVKIIESYRKAQDLALDSKACAVVAIEEAIRCGAMCNAKKVELGHGHWEEWVETYLPEIKKDARTLRRYMQFEKRSHCDRFEQTSPKSLRQAFVVTGIFPDPVVGQRKRLNGQDKPLKPTNGNANLRTAITEFRAQKPIEALIQIQDFSNWDEVELETISRLLAPITAAHSRMIHALSAKLRPSNGMMFQS